MNKGAIIENNITNIEEYKEATQTIATIFGLTDLKNSINHLKLVEIILAIDENLDETIARLTTIRDGLESFSKQHLSFAPSKKDHINSNVLTDKGAHQLKK